ncbi:MAG: SNF2-related protein, partial [Chloroflexota bacterium]|nr:SNF2-related protein [Chloroflexota bacterium]
MPNRRELMSRDLALLEGPIRKFGGPVRVAELLSYPYHFAPALERRERLRLLEPALLELHRSQRLLPGQVMFLLRLAGLLSWTNVRDTWQRLQAATGSSDPVLDAQIAQLALTDERFAADDLDDPEASDAVESLGPEDGESAGLLAPGAGLDFGGPEIPIAPGGVDSPELAPMGRSRTAERAELRGWSALGNLNVVDPTDALIRLSVARLKTAFYGFANEVRGTLAAPAGAPSSEQVADLKTHLAQAAFGEYGNLVDNDLVRAASDAYIADLVAALLLPRTEATFTPRLYQLDGARFVAERVRSDERPFGLLFDQPGMGKTLTTLWGLAAAGARRIAIVAPLTVKRQVWTLATIRQALPHLEEARFATSLEAGATLPLDGPAVVVLHYEELQQHDAIRRLAAPLADGSPPLDVLVLDEAHVVKERLSTSVVRGPTRDGAWLMRAGARACIGLTATPVVNELYEPVSLLHLAQGHRDTDAGRRLKTQRLRDRVDVMEFLLADSLRRLKQDVLFEIPPREERVHMVVPDARQLERDRAFLSKGRRHVTARLPEYRQLMLEAKLDWVAGAVRANLDAVTPGGLPDPKTVVLCYHRDDISEAVVQRLREDIGRNRVLYVSGETPLDERDEALRRFRAPATADAGAAVLVGTVGTVGVGVTLFDPDQPVTPHRVIFADLPYTWAEFEQGVDRLHRVGQRFPVTVDVPVVTFGDQLVGADGEQLPSFDEWIWNSLLAPKRRLADQVLDASFDVSAYTDRAIRNAIRKVLDKADEGGGVVVLA